MQTDVKSEVTKQSIEELIQQVIDTYIKTHNPKTVWREPLIAYADAQDPLFLEIKKIVGDHHAMPEDILPGARSVITYFLPFSPEIVKGNIKGEFSSLEWNYAYVETNELLNEITKELHDMLDAQGYGASLLPATYNFNPVNLQADWSHRSVAFVAGLGTFGVNNMLITQQGSCGRIGSLITDLELAPTPRPVVEYCLHKREGICRACIKKCPNDAFDYLEGQIIFDKYQCNEQLYIKPHPTYDFGDGDTCGKCMVGVPCSLKIPGKI